MISREAPFGVIGIKILVRNPGDVNRLFEHQWNFSIGITGCEFTLLDVDYQTTFWLVMRIQPNSLGTNTLPTSRLNT